MWAIIGMFALFLVGVIVGWALTMALLAPMVCDGLCSCPPWFEPDDKEE